MEVICALCAEVSGTDSSRLSVALDDPNMVNACLTRTRHYAIIPSVGPIVRGHSLLVTRDHRYSVFADSDTAALLEITDLLGTFRLRREFFRSPETTLLCFEHGSLLPCASLCSTAHAHLHLMPVPPESAAAAFRAFAREAAHLPSLRHLGAAIAAFSSYLVAFSFDHSGTARNVIVQDASTVPSQHLRRVVSRSLGRPHWNWKTHPNASLLRQTVAAGFSLNTRIGKHTTLLSES